MYVWNKNQASYIKWNKTFPTDTYGNKYIKKKTNWINYQREN